MKKILIIIIALSFLYCTNANADVYKKVKSSELDGVSFDLSNILFNNFNIVIEKAFFGGIKCTAQCSVKNKNNKDVGYTVYMSGYDSKDKMIVCFSFEPMMNIHEAGKIITLENSGMVDEKDKGRFSYFIIRVVEQKD